jgi:hypothetical protein
MGNMDQDTQDEKVDEQDLNIEQDIIMDQDIQDEE